MLLHRGARIALVLALCLALAPAAQALFIRPDLEKSPVERLVKNLEDRAKTMPKDANVRFNLARVHAMAFALKTDTCDVWKGREEQGAWFGHTPPAVPFKVQPTMDEAKQKAAKEHLAKAIAAYKEALELKSDHFAAQLGLAWCLEQSGDKPAAVKAYREVVKKAWNVEGMRKSGPLGHFIVPEAAGYLKALLDPKKDEAEIKTLDERVAYLKKLPRPVTPIAIPLRDGLRARDFEDATASVAFDADGTALPRKWTWITPDAGWLVYDKAGKGEITSALQLFGNVTFWLFWDNGYQALATLDDNADGLINGAELMHLAIWRDVNGNGISEPGEVKPLAEYGITALSVRYEVDAAHPDKIAYSPRGVFFKDGTTRPTFDVVLKQK
jgi:hypothetical protein